MLNFKTVTEVYFPSLYIRAAETASESETDKKFFHLPREKRLSVWFFWELNDLK